MSQSHREVSPLIMSRKNIVFKNNGFGNRRCSIIELDVEQ